MSRTLLRKNAVLFIALAMFLSIFQMPSAEVYAEEFYDIDLEVKYGQTEARTMLAMINDFRTGDDAWEYTEDNNQVIKYTSLGKLTYDYELERIAMQRAAELAINFSHTRPDGSDCFSAYTSSFNYSTTGENIAMGYESAESVFAVWREDYEGYEGQGHRRNMLNSDYRSVGIGHVIYNGYDYWVQEFSSAIVDTSYTVPNDSATTVTIRTTEGTNPEDQLEYYTAGDFEYVLADNGSAVITYCYAYGDVTIPEYLDGHKVAALAPKLFYGSYGITSVFIPATVEYLGIWDYVFSYCYDLRSINVDKNNPVLKSVDGVLYSKDMRILYNYPNAKSGDNYSVPAETSTLCCTSFARSQLKKLILENPNTEWYTYTFYGDDALTVIYKEGGAAQRLAESGTAYGPIFTADPNYVPPKDDPTDTVVEDVDPVDEATANDFSYNVWYYTYDLYGLTLDDEVNINNLRTQYDALSTGAKKLVDPGIIEKLEAAEAKIANLKAEALESLSDTITYAKAISNYDGKYTPESFEALQDAIANAESVAANKNATAAEIKAAMAAVEAAKAGLTENSSGVDTVDSTPVNPQPTPEDPTPVDPTPVDPQPTPEDPTPVNPQPAPVVPTPVDPTPVDPTPVDPQSAPIVAPTVPVAPTEIVDLPTVKISKPSAAKKKITVKWKKVSKKNLKKISGIQIQVATDPSFTNIVKTATAGKKKTSKTIKGLQPKTKYYVRIRAYAADNHVSAWKTKSVKVK